MTPERTSAAAIDVRGAVAKNETDRASFCRIKCHKVW